jgi:hypothetical protein
MLVWGSLSERQPCVHSFVSVLTEFCFIALLLSLTRTAVERDMASPSRKAAAQAVPADFSYKPFNLTRPLLPRELPRSLVGLHHTFGFEFGRRNNLQYVAPGHVLSCVGNTVQDLSTCRFRAQHGYVTDHHAILLSARRY